jgi:O-methyltransferase
MAYHKTAGLHRIQPMAPAAPISTGIGTIRPRDKEVGMLGPTLRRIGRKTLGQLGYDISREDSGLLEPEFGEILKKCRPYSIASRERLYAVFQATQYIVKNAIPGDFVECGVWRGGASMIALMVLKLLQDTSRKIWLYDTFAGMTEPQPKDVRRWSGKPARNLWARGRRKDYNAWCYAPTEEVEENLRVAGYPMENITLIKGDVASTLTTHVPDCIALLRLDTDWYESTLRELEVLYPRLVHRGTLLIDDYGAYQGCRAAVDEYFEKHGINLLLQRTDYTGRMAVKC